MLVHTWLKAELELHGLNATGARELMNTSLGTRYNHAQVCVWKRGGSPRKEARLYMLSRCFKWFMENELVKVDLRIEEDIERAYKQLL